MNFKSSKQVVNDHFLLRLKNLMKIKNSIILLITELHWLREVDSNYRPLGYEPNELPTAPPRDVLTVILYIDI